MKIKSIADICYTFLIIAKREVLGKWQEEKISVSSNFLLV